MNLIILSTIVDSHNAEVDKEESKVAKEMIYNEEIARRNANKANAYYKERITGSKHYRWCDPSRQAPILMPSYATVRELEMKWKRASSFDFSGGFKFINFVSEGIRSEVSAAEDD